MKGSTYERVIGQASDGRRTVRFESVKVNRSKILRVIGAAVYRLCRIGARSERDGGMLSPTKLNRWLFDEGQREGWRFLLAQAVFTSIYRGEVPPDCVTEYVGLVSWPWTDDEIRHVHQLLAEIGAREATR